MIQLIRNFPFHFFRWQKKRKFRSIQRRLFSEKKAKMQWWYFDIFFPNGSILIIAFVPHKWWKDSILSNTEDCFLAISYLNEKGKIFQFNESYNQSQLKYDTNKIEIQNRFKIEYFNKDNEEYKIYLNVKRLKGELLIIPKCNPFSGLPFGIMSGIGRILMFQAPWSSSDFRYISQIPKGLSSGKFIFDGEVSKEQGCVYHEQGWFNDLPQKLGKGWVWFHFHHPKWNLFGVLEGIAEGYLFVQSKNRVLIGGINLFKLPYKMINKEYMLQYHPKMIIGGDIIFKTNDLEFTLSNISSKVKPLIVLKSLESKQLWSTVIRSARLCITKNKKTEEVEGKMILETCWLEN